MRKLCCFVGIAALCGVASAQALRQPIPSMTESVKVWAVSACKIDYAGNQLSEWTDLSSGGIAGIGACVTGASLLFDTVGVDPATGNGVGGECIGPCPTNPAPGCRYIQGPTATYRNHRSANDMQYADGPNGRQAAMLEMLVYHGVTEALFVDVFHADTFNDCGGATATSAGAGVRLAYQAAGGTLAAGFYILAADLCANPALWLAVPDDENGAYEIRTWRDVTAMPGLPQTNGQFGIWGNPGPAARPGTSTNLHQYDDDGGAAGCATQNMPNLAYNTTDNLLDVCGECYDYTFVSVPCNFEYASVAYSFWIAAPADPCAGFLLGDSNGDGQVDNFDIDSFVAALVNPNCNTDPACLCQNNINHDAQVDNFDIDAFVACLSNLPAPGQPCP